MKVSRVLTEPQQSSCRRLDWRFLLPRPPGGSYQHLIVLGGTRNLVDTIAEPGLAQRVSTQLPADKSADAVVALHDAHIMVGAAATCLRPGGVLYQEIE